MILTIESTKFMAGNKHHTKEQVVKEEFYIQDTGNDTYTMVISQERLEDFLVLLNGSGLNAKLVD